MTERGLLSRFRGAPISPPAPSVPSKRASVRPCPCRVLPGSRHSGSGGRPHRGAGTPSPFGPWRRRRRPRGIIPGTVAEASPRLPGPGGRLGSHGAGGRAGGTLVPRPDGSGRLAQRAHLAARCAPGLKAGAGRGGAGTAGGDRGSGGWSGDQKGPRKTACPDDEQGCVPSAEGQKETQRVRGGALRDGGGGCCPGVVPGVLIPSRRVPSSLDTPRSPVSLPHCGTSWVWGRVLATPRVRGCHVWVWVRGSRGGP